MTTPEHRNAARNRQLADAIDAGALHEPGARAKLAVALRADADRLDERGDNRARLMRQQLAATAKLAELFEGVAADSLPDGWAEDLGALRAFVEVDKCDVSDAAEEPR